MLPLFLLSILVGNEIPLSRPVVEPAPFMRNAPGIASNGTIFFAAWYDQINAGIRGVRLDERGQLIDQVSIRIASGAGKPVGVGLGGRTSSSHTRAAPIRARLAWRMFFPIPVSSNKAGASNRRAR